MFASETVLSMRNIIRFLPLVILVVALPMVVMLAVDAMGEGVVVLFFGVVIATLAFRSIVKSLARRKWPTASGVITESRIDVSEGLFGWRDPDDAWLVVKYSYTVEGQTFDGDLRIGSGSNEAIGHKPEIGSTVKVYYNPQKPSDSVLVPGPGSLAHGLFALGIVGTGVGCYLIWS